MKVLADHRDKLSFQLVTEKNWDDMQNLFGDHGAYGGCWCTYWRIPRKEFSSLHSSERKEIMRGIIGSGTIPGILAYNNGEPVGWCSVAPRVEYVSLSKSRVLKQVDNKPVWSIVCFFVKRTNRKKGVMGGLIAAAVQYAESKGAGIIESYPIDPGDKNYPDPYAYTGLSKTFRQAGFVEVERRSPKRPIMRYYSKIAEGK